MAGSSSGDAPSISGFEFVKTLGAGGFSDVHLYQQKLPRRKVAVKVLHVDVLDRAMRRQFAAEANLMAQLSTHPSIATIYNAAVTDDGQPYFVMEYCSNGSLGDNYRTNLLPVADVLRIGVRVASALETAHRLGIIHRDIKPANILITDYRAPVLTDFGISVGEEVLAEGTLFRADITSTATGTGTSTHGLSVPWAPPEAFDDMPVASARSDVFSLAATLYSLLEGRTPFEVPGANNGVVQLSRRIERGERTPITREDVPASLREALSKAMAPRSTSRYHSALLFAEALGDIEAELGLPRTPIEVPETEVEADVTVVEPVVAAPQAPAAETVIETDFDETVAVARQPTEAIVTLATPAPAPAAIPEPPIAVTDATEPGTSRTRWSRKQIGIGGGAVAAILVGLIVTTAIVNTPPAPITICNRGTLSNGAQFYGTTSNDLVPIEVNDIGLTLKGGPVPYCGYQNAIGAKTIFFERDKQTRGELANTLAAHGFICSAPKDTEIPHTQACTNGGVTARMTSFDAQTPYLLVPTNLQNEQVLLLEMN